MTTNPFTEIENRLLKIEALLLDLTGKEVLPEFLTIDQAAEFISLSKSAIYKRVMDKSIPFHRSGRRLLFKKDELIKHIESMKKNTYSTKPLK